MKYNNNNNKNMRLVINASLLVKHHLCAWPDVPEWGKNKCEILCSNQYVPFRIQDKIYPRLRKIRLIVKFLDDLGNGEMFQLHEIPELEHDLGSCQWFSPHIPNLCKYLHMFVLKHMHLRPKYHQSTCTILMSASDW